MLNISFSLFSPYFRKFPPGPQFSNLSFCWKYVQKTSIWTWKLYQFIWHTQLTSTRSTLFSLLSAFRTHEFLCVTFFFDDGLGFAFPFFCFTLKCLKCVFNGCIYFWKLSGISSHIIFSFIKKVDFTSYQVSWFRQYKYTKAGNMIKLGTPKGHFEIFSSMEKTRKMIYLALIMRLF